jgi:hypothetical protein
LDLYWTGGKKIDAIISLVELKQIVKLFFNKKKKKQTNKQNQTN